MYTSYHGAKIILKCHSLALNQGCIKVAFGIWNVKYETCVMIRNDKDNVCGMWKIKVPSIKIWFQSELIVEKKYTWVMYAKMKKSVMLKYV